MLDPQKTPHTSRASTFVNICGKIDRVITALHCNTPDIFQASLSIWVLDPVIADQDELDGTANTPSQVTRWHLNPLRANFFRGNRNIYLHFVSFLHNDTTQVVEILPQIRQEPTSST